MQVENYLRNVVIKNISIERDNMIKYIILYLLFCGIITFIAALKSKCPNCRKILLFGCTKIDNRLNVFCSYCGFYLGKEDIFP